MFCASLFMLFLFYILFVYILISQAMYLFLAQGCMLQLQCHLYVAGLD